MFQILDKKCMQFDFGWGPPRTQLGELTALSETRKLHSNGDVGNTADFPVNLAVIPPGWSTLLRGCRGSGAGCLR